MLVTIYICTAILLLGWQGIAQPIPGQCVLSEGAEDSVMLLQRRMFSEGVANSRTCSWWMQSMPTVFAISVMALVLVVLGVRTKTVSSSRGLRDCLMLVVVSCNMSRTISLPDSDALSISLGRGPGWSGLFLGVNKYGEGCGELPMGILLLLPYFWRDSCRRAMICALFIMCIGSFLYLHSSWHVPEKPQDISDSFKDKLSMLLLASRAIMGCGYGMVSLMIVAILPKVTPLEELPEAYEARNFYKVLGVSLGPLASSAGYFLDFCPRSAAPRFGVVGGVQFIVVTSVLLAIILFYLPVDSQAIKTTTAPIETQKLPSRYSVVISGFMMGGMRFWVSGSVQGGTPLLLERSFAWSISEIGVITGMAFLLILPVWTAYRSIGEHMNRIIFIRMLASISVLGTVLLFKAPSHLLPKGLTLVLGDLMIFPPIFIVAGLTQGMMMQQVSSESDSRFLNHTTLGLAYGMFGCVCYGTGAVQSRWVIGVGGLSGQDIYASIILCCCICFFAIFEIGIGHQHTGLMEASSPTCGATSPPTEASCDRAT